MQRAFHVVSTTQNGTSYTEHSYNRNFTQQVPHTASLFLLTPSAIVAVFLWSACGCVTPGSSPWTPLLHPLMPASFILHHQGLDSVLPYTENILIWKVNVCLVGTQINYSRIREQLSFLLKSQGHPGHSASTALLLFRSILEDL